MALPNSDEDKYANESFEADSDVPSECASPELRSDSDDLQNRLRSTGTKNMALLASAQDRQKKLREMMARYPRSKDALPFDSSSDDDDVVFSETVAEINTGRTAYDNISTNSRRMSILQQIVETTEEDSDFQPKLNNKHLVIRSSEETALVSDVSEELELDMEMQVYKNEAHLVPPNPPEGKSPKLIDQNSYKFMQNITEKIQQELHKNSSSSLPNKDSVSKLVAQAISQLSLSENCDQIKKDEDKPQNVSVDLTHLRGGPSYTVLRPPASYKNPLYRDINENLDSPKHYKSSAYKFQDQSSHIETETCHETESEEQFDERKVERQRHQSDTHSFRSAGSDQHCKPTRSSTSCRSNNQPKSGQYNRKSWTFSNDRMRQIETENRILLQKILTQKPTVPMPHKETKYKSLPPSTFVSNAAIERKKKQRQIDLENRILKRKLESVSYRRKPFSID